MRIAPLRLAVAAVAFLALADTAIVALALPPILRELDTDVAGVAAVLGVYAVALALALPAAEWLRRRLGTRAVGVSGVALFGGASLACGLADTLDVLLIARGVQAVGGAALLVSAYALLSDEHVGRRMWQFAILLGTAAGPAIGGALTQALGWRSIFFVQAPAALLALPGVVTAREELGEPSPAAGERPPRRSRRDWQDVESGGVVRPRWAAGRVLALGLVSGAITAALFLTVLLLISGWGIEPLTAALAVTVMPLAALAVAPLRGSPGAHAAGGALLVAAGSASLAFLPTASVGWTVLPQIVVGAGMGLALPALGGRLLPERNGRDAAHLLAIRHLGIALVLLILAPIAQNELDSTLAETRERGAAIILDAPIDPRVKLDLAPKLSESVETEDPRGGLERVFAEGRSEVDDDEREDYDALAERADEVLVAGVNNGFRTAFLVGAGLALLAAFMLLPVALGYSLAGARPALAVGAVVVAGLGVVAYALAADSERPEEVVIADPCEDRDNPGSGGITGFLQDAALTAVDEVACRVGSSREELVLAMVDDDAAKEYEREYDVDPRSVIDLAGSVLPG